MVKLKRWLSCGAFVWVFFYALPSFASDADNLAKQLANPVANLISLPLQLNYDHGGGPNDRGRRYTLNIQPVIPIDLNENWNIISRTILPFVSQKNFAFDDDGWKQSGTGDTLQSFFFSPKAPTKSGMIWGVGPAILIPTGTDEFISSEKWAIGPTGVVLFQKDKLTYGALANHMFSIAGDDDHSDINSFFLQPFASYAAGGGLSYTVNIEATFDMENDQNTVPLNLMVSKVTSIGSQMISIGGGARIYMDKPNGAPDWGLRLILTLLFPK